MKKCVAVFRSRTQVMSFIEIMNAQGISAKAVPTPKEARVGCGLSAEIPVTAVNVAAVIVKRYGLNAFYSFLVIEKRGTRTTIVKL